MNPEATSKSSVRVGPTDHERPMTLPEFATSEGEPGHLYELARGRIVVIEVPKWRHGRVVMAVSDLLTAYHLEHPGTIQNMAGGAECALRLAGMQSERHPDRAVYLTPPPEAENPWDRWIPELVVEVVSRGQERRDYLEKREEYLAAGVREYWIVDPEKRAMLALRRTGDVWEETHVAPGIAYRTGLLPGLQISLDALFGPIDPQ